MLREVKMLLLDRGNGEQLGDNAQMIQYASCIGTNQCRSVNSAHANKERCPKKSASSSLVEQHQASGVNGMTSDGDAASVRSRATWTRIAPLMPFLLLVGVVLAVYANAWPNALVHDDKFYAGSHRFSEWSNIPRYFSENAWASSGVSEPLYRPLLLVSITLDARLHGDWVAGYHLTNIALHALATMLVYGFLLQVLRCGNGAPRTDSLVALLCALIFAVHPVHAEVVNSIFNRSEMLAAIGGLAGLIWLLRLLRHKPIMAWAGFFFAYSIALFCRETAVLLPAIAAILVWSLTRGDSLVKLRRILPVVWLIVPLSVYLLMRASALAPPEPVVEQAHTIAGSPSTTIDKSALPPEKPVQGQPKISKNVLQKMLHTFNVPGTKRVLAVAGLWYRSLEIMVWPRNLSTSPAPITRSDQTAGLILMALVLVVTITQAKRGSYGLALGLIFFFIALLPASRITGGLAFPHLAERYLYFPSVGLALSLAFGLRSFSGPFNAMLMASFVVAAAMVLAPLTWARNAAWASDVRLFETDYAAGNRRGELLVWLTAAHVRELNNRRVAEICDENTSAQKKSGKLSMHCAIAYGRLRDHKKAEQAYLRATRERVVAPMAHANLARFYLGHGRRNSAAKHFALAVDAESLPANQAWRRGNMLVNLYPRDREKLLEAKAHFEEALRLQPASGRARQSLRQVNSALGIR